MDGLIIVGNQNLADFCAIVNTEINGVYNVAMNLLNPTTDDLNNGNCS